MDINSKINLSPGVQLTAETINNIFDTFYQRQMSAIRTANCGRIGVLPGFQNAVRAIFVRDTLEIEVRDFMAVLPSGTMVNLDDNAVIKVPLLYGDTYYLTVSTSNRMVQFESKGTPFVRSEYTFAISTFEEMTASALFPLLRFNVKDGIFSIDEKYIMPCVLSEGNPRIAEAISEITNRLSVMSQHTNIADINFRFAIFNYLFRLTSFDGKTLVSELLQTTREMASAIDFFIARPNTDEPETIRELTFYDIELWLSWLPGYIDRAGTILDGVEVKKEEIDLESIKQELRSEIYDNIQPDLERMVNERVDNLSEALQARIEEVLKDYVNGKVLGELRDTLRQQLDYDLRAPLYSDLYQSLYAVLSAPKEEEEDTFIPLI